MKSLRIEPETPFREIPRSDTLFGAICWGIKLSRGEESLENILAEFSEGNPPFRISSVFPRIESQRSVDLLPRPKMPSTNEDENPSDTDVEISEERVDALNTWQKIEYIPSYVFRKIASGDINRSDIVETLMTEDIDLGGTSHRVSRGFLLPEGMEHPYVRKEQTRNAVNRLTNSTEGNLFHDENLFFSETGSLHVLIEGDVNTVVEGLSLIQDRGLAGGSSIGRGQFRTENVVELDLSEGSLESSEMFCNMSLYIPSSEEMEYVFKEGYYDIETRKGVVENSMSSTSSSNIWKSKVLAISEGSILPYKDKYMGQNPIVADQFENGVQQYGYALPVGIDRSVS